MVHERWPTIFAQQIDLLPLGEFHRCDVGGRQMNDVRWLDQVALEAGALNGTALINNL